MANYPNLTNQDRAACSISEIEDVRTREVVEAIVADIGKFFRDQPSQLRSPFDLAFFVEVLKDRIELVRSFVNGTVGEMPFDDEVDLFVTHSVDDPESDVSKFGIRDRQGWNYAVSSHDGRLRSVELTLLNGAFTRQNSTARLQSGEPMVVVIPEYPFDFLFMVMGTDYALAPGRQARRLLELTG